MRPAHSEEHVPAPLAERGRAGARAIRDKREARAEDEPSDRLRAQARRLEVEVDLREMVQRKDADHADGDRAEHDFHDREVLEQQLPNENIVFRHAALLQEEAKGEAEEDRSNELLRAGRRVAAARSIL